MGTIIVIIVLVGIVLLALTSQRSRQDYIFIVNPSEPSTAAGCGPLLIAVLVALLLLGIFSGAR